MPTAPSAHSFQFRAPMPACVRCAVVLVTGNLNKGFNHSASWLDMAIRNVSRHFHAS